MNFLYDTGCGIIELSCDYGLHRMDLSKLPSTPVMYVAVRTWYKYGLTNRFGNPVPPKTAACLLKINPILHRLINEAPPCILIIMLDEPFRGLQRLDPCWLRFEMCAITKSAALSEEDYLNFLGEFYATQRSA